MNDCYVKIIVILFVYQPHETKKRTNKISRIKVRRRSLVDRKVFTKISLFLRSGGNSGRKVVVTSSCFNIPHYARYEVDIPNTRCEYEGIYQPR